MNGRVDLRVACPGGIIGTGALRTVAELSGAWGIDRLTIGHRQDLLVAGIPESYVARFRAAVAPLEVDRADASGHPNITSSAAATGIMRGARWLDAGIIQSILAGIRLRPSFAVNVADPHQDLLPLTSGLVNFLAADEVDSWRIAIAADHHPRRGARAPGRHDRVTLPYLVPSEYVAEAVRAAEETVVDTGAESSRLSEDLAHAIRARLGTRLVGADAGQRLPPPEYGDYEGVHPMQSGSGYWIGMSAGTRPFRHRFLEQLCMRAAQQGIGAVFTTCWRSLVLKNVAPEHLPEWRMLLGRHGVRVRHADAALHWQVCERLPEARELAGTMIARLSRRSIVTSGLSFAVTDDPTRHEVAVAIQPLADERSLLSGLRRRYAVRHREGFDRHNPGWLTFARRLRERDLAPALADLTRRFYRDDGEPPTSEALPPEPSRRSRRSRSAPESGRAPPAATSTTPRTATRSAKWHPAPRSRRCPPAGATRFATARPPTTNPCRAPRPSPRTRPRSTEPSCPGSCPDLSCTCY